ncbi:hypothetical protein B0A52_10375 [Exophiala mesophila]|uniref:KAP NTPase domain-containing protein n=1 Tax=Exophiala mesophila TaxID=212818 RepID=A0A438MQ70_EXOME|nr:hypothetical protein B0A52_10375 [Exophiala mesophila]
MGEINDDKAEHVIPFILPLLDQHRKKHSSSPNPPPFFIGLNGVQGAGKSVLVDILKSTLRSEPHRLSTAVFSLDDLYLTHDDQVALARANPDNPLLQHRGQPSTHDVQLGLSVFADLKANRPTKIPQYNKALFSGQGDRVPASEWEQVNSDSSNRVQVVLFEGWSVGFRPLEDEDLEKKHAEAVTACRNATTDTPYLGRLGHNTLQSVKTINEALKSYDQLTSQLDAFVHIDAADPQYVYQWRLQQEAGLRAAKGSGMTDDEVKHFVDGYYPAYELYTDTLRSGVFRGIMQDPDWRGKQLRLVVDANRKVKHVIQI